jgi:hypothetical protein
MIISNKQIHKLISVVLNFGRMLEALSNKQSPTKQWITQGLQDVNEIYNEIANQQSEKLIERNSADNADK